MTNILIDADIGIVLEGVKKHLDDSFEKGILSGPISVEDYIVQHLTHIALDAFDGEHFLVEKVLYEKFKGKINTMHHSSEREKRVDIFKRLNDMKQAKASSKNPWNSRVKGSRTRARVKTAYADV